MTNCPKCGSAFDPTSKWGAKKFCSAKCANSRKHTKESNESRSVALKGKASTKSDEGRKQTGLKTKALRLARYLATPFSELGPMNRRRRVFEEQRHKCNRCGIDEWQGSKISLELEHKDGNHNNDDRENLEGLCPNCHSLTETWRGRNKFRYKH